HVEGHLVEAGNLPQHSHVLDDQWMIGTEYWTELAHTCDTALDRALIEIVTENIDAIRPGQIVEMIFVEIGYDHAVTRLNEGWRGQLGCHFPGILERHTVSAGELQIGNALARFCRPSYRFSEARFIERREASKAGTAPCSHVGRGIIRAEKLLIIVTIGGHESRKTACQARMAAQRAMLCPGQSDPLVQSEDGAGRH